MKTFKKILVAFIFLALMFPLSSYNNEVEARQATIVSKAYSRLKAKYRFGAAHSMSQIRNPRQNKFDCSGLVNWVYYQSGHSIGAKTTSSLRRVGRYVSTRNLKPGDILLFGSHAGIYVGKGYMIHAATPRINIQKVKLSGYWKRHLTAARRVI